jgi:hypothetical protein
MKQYKLRVRSGEEAPEDWSRVLVSYAGHGGIRIIQEFVMECIVEAGPVTKKMIEANLGDYVDIFEYEPGEHTPMEVKKKRDPAEVWWKT